MQKSRILFIDNIRILVITLVAMIHLSITYGGAGSWYYKEVQPDAITFAVLSWHDAVVQTFSMGLFFLIAGYFTPGSYSRKGPLRFLKDRLLRLGIPMLCYDWIINPLLIYMLFAEGSPGRFLKEYYTTFRIGTGPLWFAEALLIFAIGYVLYRVFAGTTARSAQTDGGPFGSLTIAILAVVLGVVSFIVRIWLPIGWSFEPLNLQFPFFPQYICLFIVGVAAYRRNWLMRIPDSAGRFWLCVALALILLIFPTLFVAGGAVSGDIEAFVGGVHWQSFAYALWEQLTGVAIIVALIIMFRRHLNRQGKLAQAASAGSYTAYIIHGPIVILVALAIRNITLYPLLKFMLAVLISVPLCFALANVIRKLPLARRIL